MNYRLYLVCLGLLLLFGCTNVNEISNNNEDNNQNSTENMSFGQSNEMTEVETNNSSLSQEPEGIEPELVQPDITLDDQRLTYDQRIICWGSCEENDIDRYDSDLTNYIESEFNYVGEAGSVIGISFHEDNPDALDYRSLSEDSTYSDHVIEENEFVIQGSGHTIYSIVATWQDEEENTLGVISYSFEIDIP
ncbi:hypothetical protein ACFO4L_11460 [Bacillus daqingensis]|uniref:Lipoprotein n=1 Tax=Bacillus daqingensis TaxID=872396 RepID=A0ABV9NV89_9BACI